MRHPALILMSVWVLLLAACGKETTHQKQQAAMSNDEAFEQISSMKIHGSRSAAGSEVSLDGLQAAVDEMVAKGIISPSSRGGLFSSLLNLGTLTQVVGAVQGGKTGGGAIDIATLATSLLNVNGGSIPVTTGKLSGVMGMMNLLIPLISTFAPQYAPFLQAAMVLLPQVLALFNKPKKSASAVEFVYPRIPSMA
jgi:hypothetical protein